MSHMQGCKASSERRHFRHFERISIPDANYITYHAEFSHGPQRQGQEYGVIASLVRTPEPE
jgi:hypothetical protein